MFFGTKDSAKGMYGKPVSREQKTKEEQQAFLPLAVSICRSLRALSSLALNGWTSYSCGKRLSSQRSTSSQSVDLPGLTFFPFPAELYSKLTTFAALLLGTGVDMLGLFGAATKERGGGGRSSSSSSIGEACEPCPADAIMGVTRNLDEEAGGGGVPAEAEVEGFGPSSKASENALLDDGRWE